MALARRHHRLIRLLCGAVTVAALSYSAQRANLRNDVTSDGLSELTPGTRELIRNIGVDNQVVVHAFVSREVPRAYVTARLRLLNVLREMEASGGEGLRVRIVEPKRHSPEAQEAMDKYGIMPRRMMGKAEGNEGLTEMFLGVAFVSGPRETTIPFLDRGLSVEYEIARSLRIVTQDKRKVVGVLRTDAPIMGNFDMQSMRQIPAWRITEELRKQYEVRTLNAEVDIPPDVDVLVVPQLPSLTQGELDKVRAYVDAGRPALLTVDPLPLFDLRLAPSEKKLPPPGQGGQFGGGAPSEPKGDFLTFLKDVGVEWTADKVLYDADNPHPNFSDVPPHVVFARGPFGPDADPAVRGLTEVVTLFAGALRPVEGKEGEFTPLLQTSESSGYNDFNDMVQRHVLFGLSGPITPQRRSPITGKAHTIAARIQGAAASTEEGAAKPKHLIVMADLDAFGDQFYAMHSRGGDLDGDGLDDVRFDNVTLLLNAVDTLAGDERFLELRRRQPTYRRLSRVDALTLEARAQREADIEAANAAADKSLKDAQQALKARVDAIREKSGLDENTKKIMVRSAEEAENRRLEARRAKIERDKERAIGRTETDHARRVEDVRNEIRLAAVLLPPVPPLLLGGLIFARRRRRERENIPAARRKGAASNSKATTGGGAA